MGDVEIFIPKITIAVSGSSMNSFELCPTKDHYENTLLLRPHTQAMVLDKGTLMHKVLETFYKMKKDSLPNPSDGAILAGRKLAVELDLDVKESEEVISTFNRYVYHYQGDGWEPLHIEEPFSVVIYEDETIRILYEGTIDLVAKDLQGSKKVVDHKTGSKNKKPLGLSNQFMGYATALDTQVITINKILFYKTVQENEKIFQRYNHSYDADQLKEWKDNIVNWAYNRYKTMEAKKKDETFILPMNLTSCDKYGHCTFTKICSVSREARQDIINREYKVGVLSHDEERFKDDD